MTTMFLGIRQDASREVLLFELLVAAAILAFAFVIAGQTNVERTLIAAAESLLWRQAFP